MSTFPIHDSERFYCGSRRVAAIVLTFSISLHWIPGYWAHHIMGMFSWMSEPWPYRVSMVLLGLILTIWTPRSSGLVWAQTWTRRKSLCTIGGGMMLVAIVGMLFIKVPFYGGSMSIYVCVPLYEELLFRGFLFAVVADAFPRVWHVGRMRISHATLITGVAFGVWHLGGFRLPPDGFILFQVIYTMLAGILFSIMREKSGSLFAPLLVHFIVDCWSVEIPGIGGQW